MTNPEPPNLDGWEVFCSSCLTHRPVDRHEERDSRNGELYIEYVCSECFSIVLNIHRANPSEREKLTAWNVPKLGLRSHAVGAALCANRLTHIYARRNVLLMPAAQLGTYRDWLSTRGFRGLGHFRPNLGELLAGETARHTCD
jgi:hypothetical protein